MQKKEGFIKLASSKIKEGRNIIISRNDFANCYTLVQQLITEVDGKKRFVYLKGAINFSSIEALYNLRDALNETIKKIEEIEKLEKVIEEEDAW